MTCISFTKCFGTSIPKGQTDAYMDKTLDRLSAIYASAQDVLDKQKARIQKFCRRGGSMLKLAQRAYFNRFSDLFVKLVQQKVQQIDWLSEDGKSFLRRVVIHNPEQLRTVLATIDWKNHEAQELLCAVIEHHPAIAEELIDNHKIPIQLKYIEASLKLEKDLGLTAYLFRRMCEGYRKASRERDENEKIRLDSALYDALLQIIEHYPIIATNLAKEIPNEMSHEHLEAALITEDGELISAIYGRLDKKTLFTNLVFVTEQLLTKPGRKWLLAQYFILRGNKKALEAVITHEQFSVTSELSLLTLARELKQFFYSYEDGIEAVLEKEFQRNKELAEDYRRLVWSYLVLGIEKPFKIGNTEFRDSGFFEKLVPYYTETLLGTFSHENPGLIPEEISDLFAPLCEAYTTVESLLESANNDKPVMIESGWKKHSTYVVFYKDMVIKCNRGEHCGDKSGVQAFRYKREKFNESTIIKLLQQKDAEYFLQGLDKDLDLEPIAYLPQKKQKLGNCVWASLKSAIYGTIFMINFDKNLRSKMEQQKAEKEALESSKYAYKRFTATTRLEICGLVDTEKLHASVTVGLDFRMKQVRQAFKATEKWGVLVAESFRNGQ